MSGDPWLGVDGPQAEEFVRLAAGPFRRQLLGYCYRMLGALPDAEDTVKDAFLRGWRYFGSYDPERGSLQNWLYRIATNLCFAAGGDGRGRRLPTELVAPAANPEAYPTEKYPEVTWLTPIPDTLIACEAPDPAAIVASRASVRLAFIAALQHLTSRHRAALILHDVLAWRSAEVADLLETTPAAVNSTLQRARAELANLAPVEDELSEPTDSQQGEWLDHYVAAFERADVPGLSQLLRQDVIMEMPPYLHWLSGPDATARFIGRVFALRPVGAWRMLPAAANGQPAVGAYVRGPDDALQAHSLQGFCVKSDGIARITSFVDPGLFQAFDLPLSLSG